MEKRQFITQGYGHSICLVSIITFLICLAALANALVLDAEALQS